MSHHECAQYIPNTVTCQFQYTLAASATDNHQVAVTPVGILKTLTHTYGQCARPCYEKLHGAQNQRAGVLHFITKLPKLLGLACHTYSSPKISIDMISVVTLCSPIISVGGGGGGVFVVTPGIAPPCIPDKFCNL